MFNPNQRVLGGRWGAVDFVVKQDNVDIVVEYDGQYWHSRDNSMDKDSRKTAELVQRGYVVVRLRVQGGKSKHLPVLAPVPQAINITVPEHPDDSSVQEVAQKIRSLKLHKPDKSDTI